MHMYTFAHATCRDDYEVFNYKDAFVFFGGEYTAINEIDSPPIKQELSH